MTDYEKSIENYIKEALGYLKQTKNLWLKEEHPEIIAHLENWDWKADLKKIEQLFSMAYLETNFEEKLGTLAITWDDFDNNGFTLYFGSENEYQEWMSEEWTDFPISLEDTINQLFNGIDDWYDELDVELDLFKDLFLGLVEITAIRSVKTKEFKALKKQDSYLISSTGWHDAEYDMIFNSDTAIEYELTLRDEYKATEPEVLEEGHYRIFGEIHKVSARCIRGNNSREGIIPDEIRLFKNVEELEAKNEYLKHLPDTFFSLTTLKKLDLSHNKLETLNESISKLKNLSTLEVSNNALTHLPSSLNSLDNLEQLQIQYNLLKKLPAMEKLLKLDFLCAHNNELEELPELPASLTWLNLSNNKLKQLPKSITQLKHLKSLVLSHNSFDSVPEEILSLKALEDIDLGGNPIEELPKELLSLPNIKKITVLPNKFSIEKREELRKTFGDILFLGYDTSLRSFMKKKRIK